MTNSIEVEGQNMIFTNLHLPGGEQNRRKRVKALNSLFLYLDSCKNFDFAFFIGDFSFSCQIDNELFYQTLDGVKFTFNKIKPFDEFYQYTSKDCRGLASAAGIEDLCTRLSKLKEQEITFPPTCNYGLDSKRPAKGSNTSPSYADRIFVLKGHKHVWIESLCYYSCLEGYGSDHRPIHAQYEVRLRN